MHWIFHICIRNTEYLKHIQSIWWHSLSLSPQLTQELSSLCTLRAIFQLRPPFQLPLVHGRNHIIILLTFHFNYEKLACAKYAEPIFTCSISGDVLYENVRIIFFARNNYIYVYHGGTFRFPLNTLHNLFLVCCNRMIVVVVVVFSYRKLLQMPSTHISNEYVFFYPICFPSSISFAFSILQSFTQHANF